MYSRLPALQPLPFISPLFTIDKQKTNHHYRRADPVQPTRILPMQQHLANKTERDGQTQTDRHDERGGEERCVGPTEVADEASRAVHEDNGEDFGRGGELKGFDMEKVEEYEAGPEEQDVGESDEPEEQRHVYARLGADAFLHQHRVEAVQDGGHKGHGVAEREFPRRLVRKGSPVRVWRARNVDAGD